MAVTAGLRWGRMRMPVPSRIVEVAAATKLSQIRRIGEVDVVGAGIRPLGSSGYSDS
ncbi:MAG: hypothetical protein U5R31_02340 [Acidimicrobiia bacterium]|nr:hypothetical protein [Acidimicrobiia bacterium]